MKQLWTLAAQTRPRTFSHKIRFAANLLGITDNLQPVGLCSLYLREKQDNHLALARVVSYLDERLVKPGNGLYLHMGLPGKFAGDPGATRYWGSGAQTYASLGLPKVLDDAKMLERLPADKVKELAKESMTKLLSRGEPLTSELLSVAASRSFSGKVSKRECQASSQAHHELREHPAQAIQLLEAGRHKLAHQVAEDNAHQRALQLEQWELEARASFNHQRQLVASGRVCTQALSNALAPCPGAASMPPSSSSFPHFEAQDLIPVPRVAVDAAEAQPVSMEDEEAELDSRVRELTLQRDLRMAQKAHAAVRENENSDEASEEVPTVIQEIEAASIKGMRESVEQGAASGNTVAIRAKLKARVTAWVERLGEDKEARSRDDLMEKLDGILSMLVFCLPAH